MENLQVLRSIAFIVGIFLLLFGIAMLIPAITNNYLGYEWKNFLVGFIVTCTFSAIFILLGKLNRVHGMPQFLRLPVVPGLHYLYLQLFHFILIV